MKGTSELTYNVTTHEWQGFTKEHKYFVVVNADVMAEELAEAEANEIDDQNADYPGYAEAWVNCHDGILVIVEEQPE